MEKEKLNTSSNSYYEEDEITLKELILKFWEYYKEIAQNKVKIFAVALSFALLFLLSSVYQFWKQTPTYTSKVDFTGKVEGVLKTTGYQKSYIELKDLSDFELRELSFTKALFDKVEIDGKEDFVANHFIKIYNSNVAEDFYFTKDNIAEFTLEEKKALGRLKSLIFGISIELDMQRDTMLVLGQSWNVGTGISFPLMQIAATTKNSELSKILRNSFYNKLTESYIQELEDRNERTIRILKDRRDSIYLDLLDSGNGFQNLSNSLQEERKSVLNKLLRSQTPISPDQVISKNLQVEVSLLSSKYISLYNLYDEIILSIEALEFEIKNQKVEFSHINVTYESIDNTVSFKKAIKNSGFMKGFFVGFFLIIVYLTGQKFLLNVVKEA